MNSEDFYLSRVDLEGPGEDSADEVDPYQQSVDNECTARAEMRAEMLALVCRLEESYAELLRTIYGGAS